MSDAADRVLDVEVYSEVGSLLAVVPIRYDWYLNFYVGQAIADLSGTAVRIGRNGYSVTLDEPLVVVACFRIELRLSGLDEWLQDMEPPAPPSPRKVESWRDRPPLL